jgi:alkylation response protein AidB-like acyl-CoA dehydrogenase
VADHLLNPRDLAFLLYEVLDVEALCTRARFADHSRETFDAVLDTARSIAEDHLLPHWKKSDSEEPRVENGKVVMIPEVKAAVQAIADAGFIAAIHDAAHGGMQLPHVIAGASLAWFDSANAATTSYAMLTAGAADLIVQFGDDALREKFVPPMFEGRYLGTMALTEPDAGSSLADVRTKAVPAGDGTYHITGTKIWISGGDHELTGNIIHLLLARIEGAPQGVKGISLFVVPKRHVYDDGSSGESNNVALGGIIHKMGWRGTTSALLNFGEHGPCTGYLVGEANKGLAYMFHMMNDARISVGRSATSMAYTAYRYSLEYARTRKQGRIPGEKDPLRPPVAIIEHADIRRMLLQQKAIVEGALCLVLECARLVDDQQTASDEAARTHAGLLLEALTPIAKTWPSIAGQEAISNAMQILGGYGYAREYDVEQLYRANRLNQIHEGTNGIQSLDLLGRKVTMNKGAAFRALVERMLATAAEAESALPEQTAALRAAVGALSTTTMTLVKALAGDPARALANANLYLDCASHTVVAWLWLRQALVASRALAASPSESDRLFYDGKLRAARYWFAWELPQTGPMHTLLRSLESTPFEMPLDTF